MFTSSLGPNLLIHEEEFEASSSHYLFMYLWMRRHLEFGMINKFLSRCVGDFESKKCFNMSNALDSRLPLFFSLFRSFVRSFCCRCRAGSGYDEATIIIQKS